MFLCAGNDLACEVVFNTLRTTSYGTERAEALYQLTEPKYTFVRSNSMAHRGVAVAAIAIAIQLWCIPHVMAGITAPDTTDAGTNVDIFLGCDPESPGASTVKQCGAEGTCDSGFCIQLGIDKSAWFGTDKASTKPKTCFPTKNQIVRLKTKRIGR